MNRYSSYKDSGEKWLGDIPSHWNVIRVKQVAKINNGSDYKKYESLTGYPVIGSGGQFAYASKYIYDGEVVFFGRKGTVDKPLYFKGKFWTVDTMFYAVPNDRILAKYLYYIGTRFPYDLYKTSTALPSMTQTDLGNIKITLPPLPEQQAIASYLDSATAKIDAAIAREQKMIDLLQERKQIIINHAVTKGLNPNAKLKDSGVEWVGEIPEDWEVRRFNHLITLLTDYTANGSFGDLAQNVHYQDDGFARLVRLTDLRENLNNKGVWVDKHGYDYLSKSHLHGNELLLANVGAYSGYPCIMPKVDYPCTLAPNMFLIKLDESIVDIYYIYLLLLSNTYFNWLQTIAESSAQPKLNKDNIRGLSVLVPPIKEQEKIVKFVKEELKKVDSVIPNIEKTISLLTERKQIIINDVVTGKIKVF